MEYARATGYDGSIAIVAERQLDLEVLAAQGALDGGHDVEVFLLGEAVYLMKTQIADAVNPVAFPNVGTMLRDLIGRGVRFYV